MYKKTHPQGLILSIWICCCLIALLSNTFFIVPSIIFLVFGLIGLYFTIFTDGCIQQINKTHSGIYIKYKKGLQKQKIELKNEEIQKLVFNFYVKTALKRHAGFYNYVIWDIVITLNSGEKIKLKDDYVMNGFVWHVGKNIRQINSIKTLVKMFNGFEKFSYNIKNTHAIYDKRFEPEAIKVFIND